MGNFQIAKLLGENINPENLLTTLFQDYPDAIWIKNKNLELIGANKFYYDYFYPKDTNKNININKIEQKLNNIDNEILKTHKSKTYNIRSTDKTQTLSIKAIPILQNNALDNILYISQNITQQEELKERFFVNKYQLNALLENIPKIIYMKDLEGNYITGTKHSKEFFSSGFDYFHNVKLDFSKIRNHNSYEDQFIIENHKIISYEKELYDTNGLPHWYKVYKAPINDYNNDVIGIIVIAQNIEDEKNLQGQRETFVASLGHDLKNPTLAQIRAIELLLKENFGKISNEQKEILNMVLDSCKYMNAMLASLLATYRNEKGVVSLNYDELSLSDLTNECIGEMIYLAKDKNIKIELNSTSEKPLIYGDKVQIKRVLMNLLSNGIKYAFKNSTLKIKIYTNANYTCFELENNSPYIPSEKRESIFAQYVSFADAHKELGIGLGLYASKKIIDAHGGSINVESYLDQRNIFSFKLPSTKGNICASKTVTF